MNYRYGILATALAVSLLAVPATAGVTDVTGGQGVEVKTTVRNNYTDTESYVTNQKKLDTIYKNGGTIDKSKVQYTVNGHLDYEGEHNHGRDLTHNFGSTASNYTDAYNAVSNNLRSFDSDYQQGRVGTRKWQMSQSEYNKAYWLNGSDGSFMGNSYSESVSGPTPSGSIKETKSTKTERTTDYTTAYKENKSKMSTTYTGSKLTYTGTTYDPGTILVGDPDAIFNAYTANGKATINEIRDDYYTRNHVYERDHVTQDTVTTTTTKTGTITYTYQLNAKRVWSPIILDLDGDGKIEASNGQYLAHDSFSDKVVSFDFFGNGFPMLMEWVGPNDGLLCHPNADGSVKGNNLFGSANGFKNGYEEMASLDVDNSGSLEGAELKDLRVWTDVNANGIAEANELKSLDELGITSIKVSHNNYASTFVRNGQTFKSFDWWPNCREMRKVDMASVIK